MSRTTGRALELLGLLQARSAWTGAQLRERLEVSDRTLRRDIDDLRSLGYGIEATRGRHGGYRLGPGASVPPLTLCQDEAVAIAVGLRAAALGTVTGLEDPAARALAKLEQSLSSVTRRQISDVAAAMLPLDRHDGVDLDIVIAIARAIGENRVLRIRYTRHKGTTSDRAVEPHRIVQTATRWYLVAWDVERGNWRTLRIDRIASPTVQQSTFVRRPMPDDRLRELTTSSISTSPYRYQATVRMHAAASVVTRHFGPSVAQVTAVDDATCLLTTGANAPEQVALYLGLSGIDFDVLDGDEVRSAVAALAARFTRSTHQ